jgi:hypothetical protein
MNPEPPDRLTDRAFLVAYDVERHKVTGTSSHGQLVRAAALVELTLAGHLVDEDGKPHGTGGRTGDPVLDTVLDMIAASRPRSWRHWVEKEHKVTYRAVRERLTDAGVIATTHRRILGLFPSTTVTVPDTRTVRRLVADLRRVVLGGTPAEQLDPLDVALVPLVAAVELNTVFSGRERREHRVEIRALAERAGPAAKALRKAVEGSRAAAAG